MNQLSAYVRIEVTFDILFEQIFRHSALAHYDILNLETKELYKLSEVCLFMHFMPISSMQTS